MTFQIGEKVVYPNQGVGTIENIRAWALGSQFEKCYLLRMVYGSVTVTVPFSKVANIGLRPITKNTEISRVLSYLATGSCLSSSDWKVRFKANSEKMLSGSLLHAAEVLKSLLELQKDKLLSFREKNAGPLPAHAGHRDFDRARRPRAGGRCALAEVPG